MEARIVLPSEDELSDMPSSWIKAIHTMLQDYTKNRLEQYLDAPDVACETVDSTPIITEHARRRRPIDYRRIEDKRRLLDDSILQRKVFHKPWGLHGEQALEIKSMQNSGRLPVSDTLLVQGCERRTYEYTKMIHTLLNWGIREENQKIQNIEFWRMDINKVAPGIDRFHLDESRRLYLANAGKIQEMAHAHLFEDQCQFINTSCVLSTREFGKWEKKAGKETVAQVMNRDSDLWGSIIPHISDEWRKEYSRSLVFQPFGVNAAQEIVIPEDARWNTDQVKQKIIERVLGTIYILFNSVSAHYQINPYKNHIYEGKGKMLYVVTIWDLALRETPSLDNLELSNSFFSDMGQEVKQWYQ